MLILLIGNPHFKKAFKALGHEVISVTGQKGEYLDVNRFQCDLIIVHESLGMRQIPHGIENAAVPTVFYSIDVHLNFYWHKEYARMFDYVFVSQKDYIHQFEHQNVCWLPWSIDTGLFKDHGLKRDKDITFVGTVDSHRIKRSNILSLLSKNFEVHIYGTDPGQRLNKTEMARIYSQSKIVLNESIKDEVTFRTFEATACGAMLLTERVSNGLADLFLDNEDIITYDPSDLMDKAGYYLSCPAEREKIALNGQKRTLLFHNTLKRAEKLLSVIMKNDFRKMKIDKERLMTAYGKTLYYTGIRFEGHSRRRIKRAKVILKSVFRDNPDNLDAAVFLSLIYASNKEFHKGLEVLNGLIKMNKADFKIKCIYGFLLLETGKVNEAIECFNGLGLKKCRDIENLLVEIGNKYLEKGNVCELGAVKSNSIPVNALECYLASDTLTALLKRADLFFCIGLYSDACEVYKQILTTEPHNQEIKDKLKLSRRYLYDFEAEGRAFKQVI